MESNIGHRITAFRERSELTREQLAERAGLDPDMVAALENDNRTPSLGPLIKIARALGVRLGTFLDDVEVTDPLIVRRADRTPEIATHSRGGKRDTVRFYSLGRGKSDRHMEPFFIELSPEQGEVELSSHQGEEFMVVLSGRVKLIHGREHHELAPGDSLYFNSTAPHYVGCAGDEPASIYAVLYFPE